MTLATARFWVALAGFVLCAGVLITTVTGVLGRTGGVVVAVVTLAWVWTYVVWRQV